MREHPKIQRGDDGSLRLGFGQYGETVEVAAISGDGGRVLTVREVGVAEVWDARTGATVGRLTPDSPLRGVPGASPFAGEFVVFIESAALDHDGSLALLGLNDGTAAVFRVADGRRLAQLHPPDEAPASKWRVIRAVAYAGPHALVGFHGRRVGVWSHDGARRLAWLEPPDGERLIGRPFVRDTMVSRVAGSPDGRWIFAGHADMTADVWDARDGSLVLAAREHAEDTVAVFDGPAGCGWATSAGNVWLARPGEPARKLLATGEPWAEVVVRDPKLLARDIDGAITSWSFAGERLALHAGPAPGNWSDRARTLAFADDGALLFPEGGKRVAVLRGGRRTLVERAAQLVEARFTPAGEAIVTEGWLDHVELWSLPDGALLRTFAAPGGVGAFALSRDGSALAIGQLGQGGGRYPRSVLVYATTSAAREQELLGHDWQISHVAFSPTGDRIASIGGELLIFERATGRIAQRLAVDRTTSGLHYLPDGRLLVLDEGRARLVAADGAVRSFAAPIAFRTPWCVSDDQRHLLVGLRQRLFRLDLSTGAREQWNAPIVRPEWLPSEALRRRAPLRVGAAVWRTPHGLFLHQSDGPRGWVEPLSLSGARVVVPTEDGAALVDLSGEPFVVGSLPFGGKLRASASVAGEVLLVNDEGQLFRAPEPRPARRRR